MVAIMTPSKSLSKLDRFRGHPSCREGLRELKEKGLALADGHAGTGGEDGGAFSRHLFPRIRRWKTVDHLRYFGKLASFSACSIAFRADAALLSMSRIMSRA